MHLENSNFGSLPMIYEIVDAWGRRYIGSSINVERRWKEHRAQLAAGKHHSIFLQKAFDSFGPDSFKFNVIETVSCESNLLEREQFYIDTVKPEYNVCQTAGRIDASSSQVKEARFERSIERTVKDHTRLTKMRRRDEVSRLDMLTLICLMIEHVRLNPGSVSDESLASWRDACNRAEAGRPPFKLSDNRQYYGQWSALIDAIPFQEVTGAYARAIAAKRNVDLLDAVFEAEAVAKRWGFSIVSRLKNAA